jgi:hypothetical protein
MDEIGQQDDPLAMDEEKKRGNYTRKPRLAYRGL